MNRKEFLKRLLQIASSAAASAIPVTANATNEKTYLHDDIFYRHSGNDRLVYFRKEHPVYLELEKRLSGRIEGKEKFRCYLPMRNFVFQVKKTYTMPDFDNLILLLSGLYEKKNHYSKSEKGTFMRFIHQKDNNTYYPDLFLAQ